MPRAGRHACTYRIALRKSPEGYSVSVPGLQGCWSQGATQTEAVRNIGFAIREYLAAARRIARGALIRDVEVRV